MPALPLLRRLAKALDSTLNLAIDEGDSRVRTGHGPQNMATLRSVAMNFLRRMGSSIADACRQLALAPHTAPLDLFGIPCDLHIHA